MDAPLITSDPSVMLGKPVVAGTRITVELILRKLGAGETIEQILDSHPQVSREAVHAALSFAADALSSEAISPEEVPEWHKQILAERLAEAAANPGGGLPWREALATIRGRQ